MREKMNQIKKGSIVYTTDACNGCNKCTSVCEVFGANVTSASESKITVQTSSKCVNCGNCIKACPHNARAYRDDTLVFMKDLANKKNISLLVDPAFYLTYGDKAEQILGYLKEKGMNCIYDISFGAELSMWAHASYLKGGREGENKAYIANSCQALIRTIEFHYPFLLKQLIPVHSPDVCTAIYAQKYLGDDSLFASLTPCVAQISKSSEFEKERIISYTITFKGIMSYIGDIDFSAYSAKSDLKTDGIGNLISYSDSFLQGIGRFFPPDSMMIHYSNPKDALMVNAVRNLDSGEEVHKHPLLVTLSNCSLGCLQGPGVPVDVRNHDDSLKYYNIMRKKAYAILGTDLSPDERFERECKRFENVDVNDFVREYRDLSQKEDDIPEEQIQQIFREMYKVIPSKQVMDCGACGYKTCREMAIAVARGYSKKQSCVHFMNDDIREKSFYDMQFGILNSAGFMRNTAMLLAQSGGRIKYVVAFANISKLRNVNELYGKFAGDRVLRFISEQFKDFIGTDGICARMGGSIFALCFPYSEERMQLLMSRKNFDLKTLGIDFPLTMKCGLNFVRPGADINHLVNEASYASEQSVDTTRNSFIFFDEEMSERMSTDLLVTSEMKGALEREEFQVYFQPQYNYATGEIVGVEALCRWKKADGTILKPGQFIPIFEKNGFIWNLDRYVWDKVFAMVVRWQNEGRRVIPVSVNISRISLSDDNSIERLEKLVKKYNVDTSLICIEITESAYIENNKLLADRIEKVRSMGFRVAMDDFGSGYSSLNLLKDIPLDKLKLDMGFLRGDVNSGRGYDIISHMIRMAGTLGLEVVAEGVENKEQADVLYENGCEVMQGYLYAEPMSVSEYEELLKERDRK